MKSVHSSRYSFLSYLFFLLLTSCATVAPEPPPEMADNFNGLPLYQGQAPYSSAFRQEKFSSLVPQNIVTKEKVILVDPKIYAWGAYDRTGRLVRAGMASSGGDYCADEGRPCRTGTGTFRIKSLGNANCISRKYPLGEGGSLMPYCMFFNGGESLHGTPDQMLAEENVSHGCVRIRIPDAEWLRYSFAQVGTKVVILPYGS